MQIRPLSFRPFHLHQASPPGAAGRDFSTLEVTEFATGAQSPDIIGSLITHRPWFNLWPDTYFLTQINDKQFP